MSLVVFNSLHRASRPHVALQVQMNSGMQSGVGAVAALVESPAAKLKRFFGWNGGQGSRRHPGHSGPRQSEVCGKKSGKYAKSPMAARGAQLRPGSPLGQTPGVEGFRFPARPHIRLERCQGASCHPSGQQDKTSHTHPGRHRAVSADRAGQHQKLAVSRPQPAPPRALCSRTDFGRRHGRGGPIPKHGEGSRQTGCPGNGRPSQECLELYRAQLPRSGFDKGQVA